MEKQIEKLEIGINGFSKVFKIKQDLISIQEKTDFKDYKLEKIEQINYLNREFGCIYSIFFIEGENISSLFSSLQLPFLSKGRRKSLDNFLTSQNYIFLNKKLLYKSS
jgi:hypothetical protein